MNGPLPIVHTGTAVRCVHGGVAHVAGPDSPARVLVEAGAVVTTAAICVIDGCPGAPDPCTTGRWLSGSARVRVEGRRVVRVDDASACEPGGAPLVVVAEGRVVAG